MEDLIHRLLTLAREVPDCRDFLSRARDLAPAAQLEDLLGAEFLGLESFFRWAREAASEPGLVEHPLARLLRQQCQDLALELGNLVLQHDTLVHGTIPALEADFLGKVGGPRVRLLEIQVENRRLKRRIQAIQASLNRGMEPDLEEIEKQLEVEFQIWTDQIQQQRREVDRARQALGHLLKPEDAGQIRSLYRELVKLLHPDLNPPTPERARLWLQVQQAYQTTDLPGLHILAGLARRLEDVAPWDQTTALENLRQHRDHLKTQVQTLADRLQALTQSFPCDHEDRLADPTWVAEQNRQTSEQIERELHAQAALRARLQALMEPDRE